MARKQRQRRQKAGQWITFRPSTRTVLSRPRLHGFAIQCSLWLPVKDEKESYGQEDGCMKRRDFLISATVASAGLAFSKAEYLFAGNAPAGAWRTFDVTTHVEVL